MAITRDVVAWSSCMQSILNRVTQFAGVPRPVTLVGPTGVGKGMIARLLHEQSGRPGELVGLPGGSLSETLLHSQLFGHCRGAFTGAQDSRKGAFESARSGTLFLDELPHWSPTAQTAVLRALAEGTFRPLGAERDLPVTCRIVLGSTHHLDELVAQDRLLPDLRWRAGLFDICIPPLAQRPGDILPLAAHYLGSACAEFGYAQPIGLSPAVIQILLSHTWLGNVRELKAAVDYGAVLAAHDRSAVLEPRHLPGPLGAHPARPVTALDPVSFDEVLSWTLMQTGGHRGEVARLLGLHRNTVSRRALAIVS